jgi:general secretion pathway protein J
MTPTSPVQRGFTLIEVLVSLALMSMLATLLISSLELGGHTWQRVTREATNMEEIELAQDFLRQRFSSIYPDRGNAPSASVSNSGGFVSGVGNAIGFSGFAPNSADAGLLRYEIAMSTSEPGCLEVRYRSARAGLTTSAAADWSHERLVSHVAGLSIQFLEKPSGLPGRWVDHWNDTTHLPRLIRIDVSFAREDRRRWPPLYVEPRIDTNTNCLFDRVIRRCRNET